MAKVLDELTERLAPDAEASVSAEWSASHTELVPKLLAVIRTDRGSEKYRCSRIIRLAAEREPAEVYPWFEDMAALIGSGNSFIRWDAIATLASLLPVDRENRFAAYYERYFGLIRSDSMITACTVIAQVARIIRVHPEYEPDLTDRLLQVSSHVFRHKGEPSPECGRIVCGVVIDCFSAYFPEASRQADILAFVAAQRVNPRRSVARKAEAFLKRFGSGSPC